MNCVSSCFDQIIERMCSCRPLWSHSKGMAPTEFSWCPSIKPSVYLYMPAKCFLYVCLWCLWVYVCVCVCLLALLSLYQSVCLSVYLFISIDLNICLCITLSVCPSVCLFVYLSIFVHLSIHEFVYLFAHISVCL